MHFPGECAIIGEQGKGDSMNDDLEEIRARLTKAEGGAIDYRTKKKSYEAATGSHSRRESPKKWGYKLVKFELAVSYQEIEEEINKLGEQGWELIAIEYQVWVFKRPE
jgi:hypothetical protein